MSGSLASLSTLINTHKPAFKEIEVRTWTEDHASHQQFRKSVEDAHLEIECKRSSDPLKWHFRPMQVDSVPAIRRLIRYVRENWHDDSPIVLLTEEATAFGNIRKSNIEESTSDSTCDSLNKSHVPPLIESKNGGDDKPQGPYDKVWTIPFPRNLSQLRNASEKQDHLPGFGDDSRRSELPRNGILMSLKQETEAALEIPTFSKEQTPVSQESVLFTMGSLLKTGAIHYVGILATDPLDTLFLARYLHRASPNIRIFTVDADLLFEHGSDSSDYSGILTISTYPLIPLTQVWSGSYDSVYPFPTSTSEAIYNSELEILSALPGIKSGISASSRDLLNPFSHAPKSSWVTVAGRSGFEPVAVLYDKEAPSVKAGKPRFPPEYWPGWGYAFLAMLAFCIAFCGLMLFARPNGRRSIALFSAQPDELPPIEDKDAAAACYDPVPRAFYLFSIGIGLSLLTLSWLVVPAVVLQWNIDPTRHALEKAGGFLFLAGVLIVLALQLGAWDRMPAHDLRDDFRAIAKSSTARGASVLSSFAFLLIGASNLLSCPVAKPQTYVLPRLWLLFCLGALCIGATLTASVLPFWNFVKASARPSRTTAS